MTAPSRPPVLPSVRLYRALLRLFPSSFRTEYGAELVRTFEESLRDRGPVSSMLAAVADVVPNAAMAHGRILRQDLGYAVRTLRRSRGFALTVIGMTALGVGANTATFSVADFVLLRPLPFPEPESIVRLCEGPREGGGWGCMNELSPANYRDVTTMTRSFREWGAFTGASVNLVGNGEPARIPALSVSAQVLPLLGVAPYLGRVFDTTNATGRPGAEVILGYGLWQSRFGGDPRVMGSTIRLDGNPYQVIGVMPPGFQFPNPEPQMWLPLRLTEEDFLDRANTFLHGVARLKKGVSFEQAHAELSTVATRLASAHPATNAETGFSFFRQRDLVFPRFRIMLLALCGASLSLLLLTGANLANLLLARGASRERELAVRAALGAGRERLVRQMFTESVLLALAGGLVGVVVAKLSMPLLAHLIPTTLPFGGGPELDPRALVIAGVFTALTGLGFGLLPALRVGGRTGFTALRDGTRGGGGRRQKLRTVLVTAEVAISVVMLVSTALLIRAVLRVQAVDPGFVAEGVLTMRTTLPSPRYDSLVRRTAFYRRVLDGVRVLPGIEAAAYTSGIPMVLTGGIAGIEVPGSEETANRRVSGVSLRIITPQFFESLRLPILQGRDFAETDRTGGPLVAVISQSLAERYWPGRSPLGLSFRIASRNTNLTGDRTVVGVVGEMKVRGLERTNEPQLYIPAEQMPLGIGGLYPPKDLVIRSSARSGNLLPAVRDIIRQADPEQPISDVSWLTDVVARETQSREAQVRILAALASIALLLTGVGIYGLLAYIVAERTREIGVRLALGAEPGQVARLIIGEAARLALLGGIPGLLLAYWAARTMRALLFGLGPGDPLTIAAGVVVVALVTVAGSMAPALRAVRVSPVVAMRAE